MFSKEFLLWLSLIYPTWNELCLKFLLLKSIDKEGPKNLEKDQDLMIVIRKVLNGFVVNAPFWILIGDKNVRNAIKPNPPSFLHQDLKIGDAQNVITWIMREESNAIDVNFLKTSEFDSFKVWILWISLELFWILI